MGITSRPEMMRLCFREVAWDGILLCGVWRGANREIGVPGDRSRKETQA
jgi:hypothetical protein